MAVSPDTTETKRIIDLSKVLRLRSMLQSLHAEVRDLSADESSLQQLATVHNKIQSQLTTAIPTELGAELAEFSACCHDNPHPSKPEIRVAQAQLIGWIEGLMQGVQVAAAAAGEEAEEQNSEPPDDDSAVEQNRYNPNTYL